jgi:D-glucosaminate-6-phosphate ammonia-lyase
MPPIANHLPHLHIKWDFSKISVGDVQKKLREGDPAIEVTPSGRSELVVNTWVAQPGDAEIVARRLKEILKSALG